MKIAGGETPTTSLFTAFECWVLTVEPGVNEIRFTRALSSAGARDCGEDNRARLMSSLFNGDPCSIECRCPAKSVNCQIISNIVDALASVLLGHL
jgi:hypothetical protein